MSIYKNFLLHLAINLYLKNKRVVCFNIFGFNETHKEINSNK